MRRRIFPAHSRRYLPWLLALLGVVGLGVMLYTVVPPHAKPTPYITDFPASTGGSWWKPSPGTTWQWQLSGEVDTSIDVQMYDIDLFDVPAEVVGRLQREGRAVVCYFSAGTYEQWRPDQADFPPAVLGKTLPDWPSERWLDIRQVEGLAPVILHRLDLAVQKGCDGVEPDNLDGYVNDTGFPLTYADQLAYNLWLAEQAHTRGLSVGLKNDLDQVDDLQPYFDWALNEECFTYQECDRLSPFVDGGKAVFGVEYSLEPADFCPQANALDFDFLRKEPELGTWRLDCR